MKEIVVASGKGGTGKTSITASLACLASSKVMADCDVDASNLHILMGAKPVAGRDFMGTKKSKIKIGHCVACGKCEEVCSFDAIFFDGPGNGRVEKTFRIDPVKCEGCGLCYHFCNHNAIEYGEVANGKIFETEGRYGPFVHAKLGIAESNSGKLVSEVRERAKKLAESKGLDLVIIDGAPGLGCPVTASLTGVSYVVVVTEPTLSGLHDMKRVVELVTHFGIKSGLVINRFDLNEKQALMIEEEGRKLSMDILGNVHYDSKVTEAQIMGKPIVEFDNSQAAKDIINVWENLKKVVDIH
jgi:MinD superfamily P-loop ATPase